MKLNMIPLSKLDAYLDVLKKTSTKTKAVTTEPDSNNTPENMMRLIQNREK